MNITVMYDEEYSDDKIKKLELLGRINPVKEIGKIKTIKDEDLHEIRDDHNINSFESFYDAVTHALRLKTKNKRAVIRTIKFVKEKNGK